MNLPHPLPECIVYLDWPQNQLKPGKRSQNDTSLRILLLKAKFGILKTYIRDKTNFSGKKDYVTLPVFIKAKNSLTEAEALKKERKTYVY